MTLKNVVSKLWVMGIPQWNIFFYLNNISRLKAVLGFILDGLPYPINKCFERWWGGGDIEGGRGEGGEKQEKGEEEEVKVYHESVQLFVTLLRLVLPCYGSGPEGDADAAAYVAIAASLMAPGGWGITLTDLFSRAQKHKLRNEDKNDDLKVPWCCQLLRHAMRGTEWKISTHELWKAT